MTKKIHPHGAERLPRTYFQTQDLILPGVIGSLFYTFTLNINFASFVCLVCKIFIFMSIKQTTTTTKN